MNYTIIFGLIVTCWTFGIFGATIQHVRSEHSGLADMEASETGYAYQTFSGHPTSYVQFSNHAAAAQPVVYYIPQEESHGEEEHDSHSSAHGEKGDSGYESKHDYDKGEKGKHGHEHQTGYYKDNAGKKYGEHESADHYQQHHQSGKGYKGGKSGESQHHKKGQKTTGFHNVYHKDEYKKDHKFYDEADKNGYYEKYGNEESEHSKEQGGHEKGGKSEEGYHHDNFGKKGAHDKGHYEKEDEGFKGEKGHEAHHSSYSDFAKKGSESDEAEQGYEDGHGHGHGDY